MNLVELQSFATILVPYAVQVCRFERSGICHVMSPNALLQSPCNTDSVI